MFGKQCTARIEEHYDNIAVVMLGTLDVTEEDEEYLKVTHSIFFENLHHDILKVFILIYECVRYLQSFYINF